MAIGSNTLGLLFKIGVDAKDAEQQLSGLKNVLGDMGDAFTKGLGEGATKGAKDAEKALTSTQGALKNLGASAQQARAGVQEVFSGDVIQGSINLTRSLGPLGLALAGVAAAAAAVGFAIKGAIDAAHDIGTTSKDDFDELQKKVQSAGQSITELQRAMAGGILDALDKISGATTALFAKILEKDGKALIALLNEIASFITGTLIPLIDKYGDKIADMIARTIALWRVANKEFSLGDFVRGLPTLEEDFAKALADVRAEIAAINPQAKTLVETHKAHAAALKDLTQAQLEQNRAQRELDEQQATAAAQRAEIDRQLKAGAITAKEAAGRRLAIEQNLRIAEDALLDAQKKRIEAEVKGENARTNALEENASKRTILEKKAAADQAAINAQQEKDQIKQDEDHLKRLDKILEGEKELNAIIKERARLAQEVPGGGVAGADRGLATIPGVPSLTDALKNLPPPVPPSFLDELGKALEGSGDMFTTWSDLAINAFQGVAAAAKQTLSAFILTGKGGALAFKQLAADIIATIVVQSAVKALFELAEYFAMLFINPPAAQAHLRAAALYGAVAVAAGAAAAAIGASGGLGGGAAGAAAGAGTFGGENAAPGTVTINQGAAATTLGVALQSQQALLDIRDSLSNINTAPPGDVLQRGVDQNPMAVGHGVNEAGRRDGTVTRNFLEIAGLRPA